jgi:hypothetical protein
MSNADDNLQFYQDTLETNDDEKEGDSEMKENEKNADRDVAGLKGKSEEEEEEEEEEEDQKCKY